jgi:hypothetical protein
MGLLLRSWSDRGVLVVHAIGLLTLEEARRLREMVVDMVARTTRAVVLDLRKCATLIAPDGWERLAKDSVLTLPIGIVCSSAQFDTAAAFAGRAAELGFKRYVFDDLKEALQWALDEATA